MSALGTKRTSSTKNKAQKTPLFPPQVHQFAARRVTDSVALLQIGAGVFIGLSVLSYSIHDASLNTASTNASTVNWMGSVGAVISDVLIQSFGAAIYLLPTLFILWGARLLARKTQNRFAWRATGAICALFGLSLLMAFFKTPTIWNATTHIAGSIGVISFNALTHVLFPIITGFTNIAISIAAFSLAVIGIGLGSGLSLAEWKKIKSITFKTIASITYALKLKFYKAMKWHDHYENLVLETKVPKPPRAKAPVIAKRALFDNAPQTESTTAASKMKIIAPKETKAGKRAAEEQQPKLRLGETDYWETPALNLLQDVPSEQTNRVDHKALEKNAALLQTVLEDFNVYGEIIKVNPGPIVTLYEFEPAPGTKSSRVIGLADDIARSMSATSVRVAVIPGKNALGIEMPNLTRETIYMREMLASRNYEMTKAKLPLILGKDIGGEPIIADLARMPHLLVAGTTGSGKSVSINTMLLSLLYKFSPEECRLIMIDPKMLELSVYDDIPHLLTPVVTEPHKAITALKWAVNEMEDRYRSMSKLGVRNIEGYNKRILEAQKTGEIIMHKVQTGFDPETGKPMYEEQAMSMNELPYIVIIVDEFADLMLVAGKDVEGAIQRLAQMARAAGIHLIMATQRPSVDVITGVIKANFPTRISFSVTSKVDSRTILGEGGAEQLLGMGDMLYMASGGKIKRVHGPFVDDDEVEHVVSFLKEQGEPDYVTNVIEDFGGDNGIAGISAGGSRDGYDELYDQAVQLVITERKASTSFVQRHLQIGYNRAARIIEQMEKDRLIGPANHVGKREILLETRE